MDSGQSRDIHFSRCAQPVARVKGCIRSRSVYVLACAVRVRVTERIDSHGTGTVSAAPQAASLRSEHTASSLTREHASTGSLTESRALADQPDGQEWSPQSGRTLRCGSPR
eukprot:3407344-Rhodomonas_salina.1